MDFSYAGYMGGGVSIPVIPAKITIDPVAGDNSDAIQQAIDEVSKMPLVNGFRGAIVLKAGKYDCGKPLRIEASGVVVRGSGSDISGTILNLTDKPHACFEIRGRPTVKPIGQATTIADNYVPAGASSFNVADASALTVGDSIRITRPVTEEWVRFMGMDKLTRGGQKQTWVSGNIETERVILKLEKNKIIVDVPLNDSYDAKYVPRVTVQKIVIGFTITNRHRRLSD